MGTSATPKSTGDDSKVNATVIGVGVGLAAGFAAPLLAGVALSAAGFTSTGNSITSYHSCSQIALPIQCITKERRK